MMKFSFNITLLNHWSGYLIYMFIYVQENSKLPTSNYFSEKSSDVRFKTFNLSIGSKCP